MARSSGILVSTIISTTNKLRLMLDVDVPNSVVNTFGAGFLYGASPFREVQLFIDGILAGVAWPFPV